MIRYIYFYNDVLSGQYEFFGVFVNDKVAERAFKQACSADGVVAKDLTLYKGMGFKSDSLAFVDDEETQVYCKPIFVCRGENV